MRTAEDKRAFVHDRRPHIDAIDVETKWLMSKHRDLVAFALDSDRPLTSAHDLTYVGGHHTILDFETAVAREIDPYAPTVEGHLVTHLAQGLFASDLGPCRISDGLARMLGAGADREHRGESRGHEPAALKILGLALGPACEKAGVVPPGEELRGG